MARFATILSTGRYVPERCVSNAEVGEWLGESVDEWLVKNVGVRNRHFMSESQATSDLAVEAARQALDRAGLSADRLDLVIVATDTPDYLSPSTASVVQARLGARNAGTFDINSACASFVTGLDVGRRYITGEDGMSYVLVVGAYGMSRFLDFRDKKTCTLFADGAGAVILGASAEPGIQASLLRADGTFHDALGIHIGGTATPATLETVRDQGPPTVRFVRRFPATFNTDHWPSLVSHVARRSGFECNDIDLLLFTQLNLRTIENMMQHLELPLSRTHWIMDRWGYTGSACIPMALDHACEVGKVKRGDRIVLCASGGGISMASLALIWTS